MTVGKKIMQNAIGYRCYNQQTRSEMSSHNLDRYGTSELIHAPVSIPVDSSRCILKSALSDRHPYRDADLEGDTIPLIKDRQYFLVRCACGFNISVRP